jgi:hypothetical protein
MGTELSRMPLQVEADAEQVEQEVAPVAGPAQPTPIAQPAVGAMSVGAADDPAEAEADRLADRALARLHTDHAPHDHSPAPAGTVRRSVVAGGGQEGGALDADTAARISSRAGGGRPLDEPVRRRMEGAFGHSFAGVRLHDDQGARDLSGSIQAQAFTTGNDVFLGSGVDAATSSGERVLAHELAHVVQNGRSGGRVHRLFGFGKKKPEAPKPPQGGAPDLAQEVAREDPKPQAPKPVPKKAAPVKGEEGLNSDARKAFTAAKKYDYTYEMTEAQTSAWVPQKHQKEIVDISSWSKRAGGDEDKRNLKDLLRAYILKQYVNIVRQKIKEPQLTDAGELRAPDAEEKKSLESKYYPKTIQNRDKWKGLIDKGPYAPETQTWLRDAGFAAAITMTPEDKASEGGGPKLDVRSTFIGGEILGAPRRMHLFLVYTSSEGEQTFFRGGPSGGFTVCNIGPYVPGTVDWDPSAPSVTVATGDKAVKAVDKMYRVGDVINAMQVPYVGKTWEANAGGLGGLEALLTGENCNATVWTLLDKAGIDKKKPSGLHPGWGHKLGAVLSPEKAPRLDVRENIGMGIPGKLAGDAGKIVQIYGDRGKAEKLITMPGETDIAVVNRYGRVVQIRFGPDKALGYINSDDLYVEPAARQIWVDGLPGETVPITDKSGKTLGYAEGGRQILIIDPSWLPGDEGNYKIRYVDPIDGTINGFMRGMYLVPTDPAVAPVDDDDDDDDDVVEGPGGPGDGPGEGGGPVVDDFDPAAKREPTHYFVTGANVFMFNMDGSPHPLKAAMAQDGGREVGATGVARRLPDGTIMVEFVVDGEQAWTTMAKWDEMFADEYPIKEG